MSRLTERAWKADELLAMASRMELASQRVDETWRHREVSPDAWQAWNQATKEWHAARHALYGEAFDEGFDPHMAAIRASEPAAVETAIRFLEIDPWCFHSGYAKERLLRALKAVPLSIIQAERLRSAMMRAVDNRDRQELAEWCRLAPSLELGEVLADLRRRLASDDADVRRRSSWSLERIEEYLGMKEALARRATK
jgi:hypothetical protein